MQTTFETGGAEDERRRFETPEEELRYLREQVAEKELQLQERNVESNREALTSNVIETYRHVPSKDVLHEAHEISEGEVDAILLDLPPDDDDATMAELLGVLQEKGVKNAITVAERHHSAHVADDFHRLLVQYVARGYPTPGVREREPLWEALHMTLFEVSLPEQLESANERPFRELVSTMEQFYLGMLSIADQKLTGGRHFALEVAVSGDREDIVFYIAVPSDKQDLFEKQLLSVFPKARAHVLTSDYNIFVHDGAVAAAYATTTKEALLPLRDYREFDHDPLSVLINSFTKIATTGEGAALQIIVNPVGGRYQEHYRKVVDKMQKGKSLQDALSDTPFTLGGEVLKTFRTFTGIGEKKEERKEDEPLPSADTNTIEAIRKKLETPIPLTNVRVVTSAATPERAQDILADICSSFNQFESGHGNAISWKQFAGDRALRVAKEFSYRTYAKSEGAPLSLRELTTFLHFPTKAVAATPQLKQVRAAMAPAPLGLSTSGTLLGVNSFRGNDAKIYLAREDRMRHLYVIGQTGTGKTAFLKNLIMQDIEQGEGVCFIDPHGSDIEDILGAIPENRIDDVIYFEPANTQDVMGLNMLEYDERYPEQKTFVVNELLSIFNKLFDMKVAGGPMFEQYFRNATMLVMEDPETGSTLLDVSRVLADARYRELKLSRSKNPVVNQFWREIASKAQGEAGLQNVVPYITSKFDVFTANEIMRPVVAQQHSSFKVREVMDGRKILLVNLAKGRLGDLNAHLIGLVLVGKMLMAALSRVDALQSDLPPFYLYLDEFQNVTTDSISAILSEARKYKLSLTIAHQFIAQLEESIRDAVFGNVGSMAVFRVGAEDAKFLEPQFAPVFEAQDIMNIENYHAYIRILAHGIPQKQFSLGTMPPAKGNFERGQQIKERSLRRYARPRSVVENEIAMRYGLG